MNRSYPQPTSYTDNYGTGYPPLPTRRQLSNGIAYINLQRTISEPYIPEVTPPPTPQRTIITNLQFSPRPRSSPRQRDINPQFRRQPGDRNVRTAGDFLDDELGASGDRYVSTMLGQPQSQGDCPPGTRFYYGDGVTGYNICQDR